MVSRKSIASHLLVLGVGALICIAQAFPLVSRSQTHAFDAGDSLLNARILAWLNHALLEPEISIWDSPIFYPARNTLAFGDNLLGNLPITGPIQSLTQNPILTANLLGFISLVLTLFSVFLLVRHLTGSYWGGLIMGALFAFNPYRWSHFNHLQLLPFFWTPLALLFTHKFLKDHKGRDFALVLLFTCGQYYASLYLGTILLTLLMVQFFIHIVLERRGRDWWIYLKEPRLRKMIVLGFFTAALVLLPLGYPYIKTLFEWNAQRSLSVNSYHSAELLSYLYPSKFLNYEWLSHKLSGFIPDGEGQLFFGLTPWVLMLAGLGLVIRQRSRISSEHASIIRRYGWTALVMFILTLGPYLKWLGQDTGIPLPYQFFYYYFPGFQGMRVPARFAQPLLLCMLVIGGVVFAHWSKKWAQWRPRTQIALIAFVAVFIIWEYAVRIVPFPVEMRLHRILAYDYLSNTHPQKPVLELPQDDGLAEKQSLINQTLHWRPLIAGVSGWIPPSYKALQQYVRHCPSKDCYENLKHIPFQTLLVHLKYFTPQQKQRWFEVDLEPLGLKFIGNMDQVLIWERLESVPSASKLQITDFFLSTEDETSSLFSEKKKLFGYFLVQPAEPGKPWHYLEKGYGEVEVTLTLKDGQKIKTVEEVEFPPYLMPGETSALAFTIGDGMTQDFTTLEIGGPLIDTFKKPRQEGIVLNKSQTSLNSKSGLLAQVEDWTIPDNGPLSAHQFILVKGKILNAGTAYWLDKKYLDKKNKPSTEGVLLVARWIHRQKGLTCNNISLDTPIVDVKGINIPHMASPGKSVQIRDYLFVPNRPGKYFLVFEMLSDSVALFNKVGPSFFKCIELTVH